MYWLPIHTSPDDSVVKDSATCHTYSTSEQKLPQPVSPKEFQKSPQQTRGESFGLCRDTTTDFSSISQTIARAVINIPRFPSHCRTEKQERHKDARQKCGRKRNTRLEKKRKIPEKLICTSFLACLFRFLPAEKRQKFLP